MSDRTIQRLFAAHAGDLNRTRQPIKNRKAIFSITHCRTKELGSSYYRCDGGQHSVELPHSCRHRSCYLCAQKQRRVWVEKQKSRLFNTPHYHVVFTVPHEYLALWRYNEKCFTQFLFKASRDTLMELMGDKRYHGVTPGILMALHTWGRQLTLHPHTHCLVTGGGLNRQGDWQATGDFLLPIRVVKALYKGKLQGLLRAAYEAQTLILPPTMTSGDFDRCYRQAQGKEWSVRIEQQYAHGKGVLLYLARYFKGGPLHPKQIQPTSDNRVLIRYFDHRARRVKLLKLKSTEFLSRFLTHVPATGVHTLRYYGLYSTASKERREGCAEQLGSLQDVDTAVDRQEELVLRCKVCQQPLRCTAQVWRGGAKGNSYKGRDRVDGFVQQADKHGHANALRHKEACYSSG